MTTQPTPQPNERPNLNNQIVITFFDDLNRARQAQQELERWDQSQPDISLGACTIIYKDKDGHLKYDSGGSMDLKKSAMIGWIGMSMISGTGPLQTVYSAAANLLGSWIKNIKREDVDRVASQVKQGKVALAVMCDDFEMQPVSRELARLGGQTMTGYSIPTNTVSQFDNIIDKAPNRNDIPLQ